MKRLVSVLVGILLVTALLHAGGAAEDEVDYPRDDISLIVPFAAGGGTDAVGRALANAVENYLEVPVTVVNRTGGSGAVGMTEGATARPDGYTLTMITREIVSLPLMGLADITADDFELIRLVNMDPALVAVQPDSPYESIHDLLADARENPGDILFASTAAPNFYILTIENDQGVSFNHIAYDGAAEAIPSVIGGHTDFTIANPGEMIGQIEGGELRPLAVMAEERLDALPDIPTFMEEGLDLVSGTWRGIAVPQGTPAEVGDVLEEAFANAVADPSFVEFMENAQLGIHNLGADEFRTFISNDTEVIRSIVDEIDL